MLMEYHSFNLKDIMSQRWSLDIVLIRHIFAGIVRGVFELHSRDIAHCDLKLTNIVLS